MSLSLLAALIMLGGAASAARIRKTKHLAVVHRRILPVVMADRPAAGKRNIRLADINQKDACSSDVLAKVAFVLETTQTIASLVFRQGVDVMHNMRAIHSVDGRLPVIQTERKVLV